MTECLSNRAEGVPSSAMRGSGDSGTTQCGTVVGPDPRFPFVWRGYPEMEPDRDVPGYVF